MSSDPLIYYDRTRVTTRWRCGRRRFWAFEFMGRGISPKQRALALEFGSILHEGLAELLLGESVGDVVRVAVAKLDAQLKAEGISELANASNQRVMEIWFLLEGLLRAADRVVIPNILAHYRPVRVEGEVLYEHDGCVLMSKPDVILERLVDELLEYLEWKSTGSNRPDWGKQWYRAVQLPAGALGVEQTLGRQLAATTVVGLYKGYWSSQYQRQESIFCYGWGDHGQLVNVYRKGLRKLAVWEAGVTCEQWVASLSDDTLREQFIHVGPIPYQEHLTRSWLRQTAISEKAQRAAREQLFGGRPLLERCALLGRQRERRYRGGERAGGGHGGQCWPAGLRIAPR